MDSVVVEIQQVSYARDQRCIFNAVSMVVPRGKIIAVMGPSGSGKTTLLRLIGGQLKPQQGQIMVNGLDVHQLSGAQLYQSRRKMGLLFQSNALFTHLNVFENVAFPLREHTQFDESMIHDIVSMKLEAVGLRGVRHFMPSELSGGMARRVALARSLVFDPDLMMYDEPFTGQDPISKGVLLRLIQRTNQLLGTTTILVSHDLEETCQIADYIYLIAGGAVIGEGSPQELRQSSEPRVKQFMHGEADGPVPFHYPVNPIKEELLSENL
jgi:phospholipid/cholesterol/gamma-HCH transport system ATP-binding protein